MKLELLNFGPIENCNLDLSKNFTIIVGQNNIGKSYAISFVYTLIKTLNKFRQVNLYYYQDAFRSEKPSNTKEVVNRINEKLGNGNNETDISNLVVDIVKKRIEIGILYSLEQALIGTFSDLNILPNRLSNKPLSIRLHSNKYQLNIGSANGKLTIEKFDINHKFYAKSIKQNRLPKSTEVKTILYHSSTNSLQLETNIDINTSRIEQEFIDQVCGQIYDVHYLPASRSGLYQSLSAFGQIVAELAKNRSLLRQKIELPGIAEPLSDYFLKLSDIRINQNEKSDNPYHEIADEIERTILRGKVTIEPKTKKILFRPDQMELDLDLSSTSSMVSEISPIATYIRHILPRSTSSKRFHPALRRKTITQMVFIEEPEAHLHPEIQTKLIALLAQLTKSTPTKIIITSHSNYIFNKSSNLLIEKILTPEQFSAILFSRGEKGSTTEELKVSELGISDKNFVDVGEQLYEEKLRLLSEIRKNA